MSHASRDDDPSYPPDANEYFTELKRKIFPNGARSLGGENNTEQGDYYYSNQEFKARLDGVRTTIYLNNKFNKNKPMDVKKFEEILKDNTDYFDLKNIYKLSDDQINELMENTAMKESVDKEKGDQA